MSLVLSPPKLVLLAVRLASTASVDSLQQLVRRHPNILRRDLVLRILLTYLPETVKSAKYVYFVEELASEELRGSSPPDPTEVVDYSSIDGLSEEEAARKIRKLHLLPLSWQDAPFDVEDDSVTLFLLRRAHRVDDETGLLSEVLELMLPFAQRIPGIQSWAVSTILPLLRRNYEYYPHAAVAHTLTEFESLSDAAGVAFLLSETGASEDRLSLVDRDLRGMIGPWLLNDRRWKVEVASPDDIASDDEAEERLVCPAWEKVLDWLTAQAASSKHWKIAVQAVEGWSGPEDTDVGDFGTAWLQEAQLAYLERRYARAALASAYVIPEATPEALEGAHKIVLKVMALLDQESALDLQQAASVLPPISNLALSFTEDANKDFTSPRNAAYMRNDLLSEINPLTSPSRAATSIQFCLILSAFLLTRAGSPSTVKRAGDLLFLQDKREQKAEAIKFIHNISARGPKNDDVYWSRARDEVLWLWHWGQPSSTSTDLGRVGGVFGRLEKEFLETEVLKALLSSTRYSLARALYEDATDKPLSETKLRETIFAAAMNAYDNASNPNRTRGGLKKCDEIIHAFPKTITKTLPETKRLEALLRATHTLSEYRLVLKQGEPFSPVVLRVHSDPISIISRVLEQNPKSYTRLLDMLEVAVNMVQAGLTARTKKPARSSLEEDQMTQLSLAEKRVTAMCIEAALLEDDYETAYSYVVSRLATSTYDEPGTRAGKSSLDADDWSWKAALQAGQYVRTAKTMRPTHLGTASGNPEIRHLEQRIECLATALRIAPTPRLQEILKTFRRCEEQLDSALAEEAASEHAWDAAGDLRGDDASAMPGGFDAMRPAVAGPGRVSFSSTSARAAAVDETPMSLFDLSRMATRAASRNLSSLSSLQSLGSTDKIRAGHGQAQAQGDEDESDAPGLEPRVRKRDQFRDAAVGTLVSGVGWLVGAQPVDRTKDP